MSQKYDIPKAKHFPLVVTTFVLKDLKHIHSWLIMIYLPCSKACSCSQGKKDDKGQHARCLSSSTRNWSAHHVAMPFFFSSHLFTTCPQLNQGLTCPAYQHAPSGICFWSNKASAFLQSANRGMNW